jgi:hypothetical protein
MRKISLYALLQGLRRAPFTAVLSVTCNEYQVTTPTPNGLGKLLLKFTQGTNDEPSIHIEGFRGEKLGLDGWRWPVKQKTVITIRSRGDTSKSQTIDRLLDKV